MVVRVNKLVYIFDVLKSKKWLWCLGIIVIAQLLLITPFFHRGLFMSHDNVQVIRIFEMFQSLKYGGFPSYWNSGLLFEFGYPLFSFYPPMVYLIGSLFVFLGINYLMATKLVFILGFIVGACGIFLLARKIFKYDSVAFVSSVVYSLSPYRAVDVYVRGALAEFFAFSLMPWVIWINICFWEEKSNLRKIRILMLLSFSLAVLILTHNLSALILLFLLFPLNVYYFFTIKKNAKSNLFKVFLSGVLTLILTCYYWFPIIIESLIVRLGSFSRFRYDLNFQTLNQLWDSPWGFLGSNQVDGMSLVLGKTIIVFSIVALIINNLKKTKIRGFINTLAGCAIVLIFFETSYSSFIWERATFLHFLQFPWRLHTVISIILSLLTGSFLFFLRQARALIYVVLFLFIASVVFFENYSYFKQARFSDKPYAAETTTWNDEYLPIWVMEKPANSAIDKIWIASGSGEIRNIEWGYLEKHFVSESSEMSVITIAHVYYPGWQVYINDKNTDIQFFNKYGLMTINVPPGNNRISFIFQKTWYRQFSINVSLFGVILIFIFLFKKIGDEQI